VKKRVERSSNDPSVVISTYEGQHCHHTVSFPRAHLLAAGHHHLYNETLPPLQQIPSSLLLDPALVISKRGTAAMSSSSPTTAQLRPLHCNQELHQQAASMYPLSSPANNVPAVVVDKGLLDDMVPPAMRHA
jgi:hypothetical protein